MNIFYFLNLNFLCRKNFEKKTHYFVKIWIPIIWVNTKILCENSSPDDVSLKIKSIKLRLIGLISITEVGTKAPAWLTFTKVEECFWPFSSKLSNQLYHVSKAGRAIKITGEFLNFKDGCNLLKSILWGKSWDSFFILNLDVWM